jgi:hypothetical protein
VADCPPHPDAERKVGKPPYESMARSVEAASSTFNPIRQGVVIAIRGYVPSVYAQGALRADREGGGPSV